ncbi:hypothetical protein [Fibrivirga algicola]|uniref:Chromosome segregation protein SMC n=1 Tax=Fibrivirga algicola TaxID=2950420 RepID=A0ABX0QLI5_9BACT|nr:hypothetical protein [Fibrivirga algicola]ARK13550.1 hypothetical protein A6C57_07855 [Fibrella sp. ES10-3-2-2]NID11747.1 hypothetical protein [Fibrivirga algicola]
MESNQQKPKANGALLAALILMTGLAGVTSYLYFDKKTVTETQEVTIAERVEELSNTRVKLDSISTALDAKIAEVQKLGGDVTELQKVKADLEADKVALSRGAKLSRANIAKYELKIQEYMAYLAEKDTAIAILQREKEVLAVDNQTLNTENVGLKTRRQQLEDTVAVVASQNQELASKVTRASALKAQNIKVLAVNPKGKEKEDDAYKAKRLDKIKLVYALADNPITQEEPKDVFIRVLDPDGAVISDMANGSGTFKSGGDEMVYTVKQTVDYDRNGKNVELLYTRGTPYRPGKYTVELYSEGFKIGAGGFAVR